MEWNIYLGGVMSTVNWGGHWYVCIYIPYLHTYTHTVNNKEHRETCDT